MAKGESTPTRFDREEQEALEQLRERSGLPLSELVRRAVRLLKMEVDKRGGSIGFIIEELGPKPYSASKRPSETMLLSEPPKKRA